MGQASILVTQWRNNQILGGVTSGIAALYEESLAGNAEAAQGRLATGLREREDKLRVEMEVPFF